MHVEFVDVENAEEYNAWFAPIRAAERFDWPSDPGWAPDELRARARHTSISRRQLFAVRDTSGIVVASAFLRMPLREDLDVAEALQLVVDPEHRRRGFGRALLDHVEKFALGEGRRRLNVSTDRPLGTETSAGEAFARAMKYDPALLSARRVLTLPIPNVKLDKLESAALPFSRASYRMITWVGPCPDEYAADRAELGASMSTDPPMGELDLEPERWDVARLRDQEALQEDMGRDVYAAGAVETASGHLIGFTDVGVPRNDPSLAYQFDTIVSRDHRGHRLGILLKLANLRTVMELSPSTGRILTWNAKDNDPMIAVNEALGFVMNGHGCFWQRRLA